MAAEWNVKLETWIRELALDVGFDAAGVAAVPDWGSGPAELEAQRFCDWIKAGRAGEMEYLKRRDESGALLRSGVQVAMPWARSDLNAGMPYGR